MPLKFFLVLLVGSLAVCGAPAPGLTVDTRTVSCCGEVKIPMNKVCLNRFSVGDMTLAEVNGAVVLAQGPFELTADGMMLLRGCVDFKHQVHCDVGEIREREERVNYQLIPCYGAPKIAAVSLGSDL